ncbi:MAG: diguanylate cyclase [Treponema sp.]|nr:diguanylate cyclase [Treponema sp.]
MDAFFRDNEIQTDSITGAYAQDTIISYASYLIQKQIPFSFALIDIDNFTYITDAFGNEGGNKVLYDVTNVINEIIKDKGVLARNKGDEFSLILKDVVDYDEIWSICHTISIMINDVELPEVGNQTITVTIGLARFPENASFYDELFTCAEKAIYRGKTKGRNCFIIYLPEKHANIVPKNEKQKFVGSLSLHSTIFKYLTTSDDIKAGIINLFNFLSSYYELDHICIQPNDSEKLLFQKIHQRSKNKRFDYIPAELIEQSMNKLTNVLYISDIKNLLKAKQEELYESYENQDISSSCLAEIFYRNKKYGFIRIDMTGSEDETRLLQYSDIDLILTAARTLGLIMHYSGKKLEDL